MKAHGQKENGMLPNPTFLHFIYHQQRHELEKAAEHARRIQEATQGQSRPGKERLPLKARVGLRLVDWGYRLIAEYPSRRMDDLPRAS